VNALQGIWINRERGGFRGAAPSAGTPGKRRDAGRGAGGDAQQERSADGCQDGAAYLADRTGVGVLPVGIWGSETAVAKTAAPAATADPRAVWALFQLPPLERGEREAGLKRNTDEIMCQIAALLPENIGGCMRSNRG